MKSFQVVWSREAAKDLEEIFEFIRQDNPAAARVWFNKVRNSCSKLKTNPARFPVVPELVDLGITHYRIASVTPYRVLFKLWQSKVFVIAVLDGRRDLEGFLFNRLLRMDER
ncbi:MAG: plasmid stabilization protein [Proteobacteria bacterium]|nr:MAG: plasmid stabilization protein [Pseudomonadota bacterium]